MSNNVKVSVVVPFNKVSGVAFSECIKSVQKQTLTDIEIIIVNDFCTDKVILDSIANYQSEDNRIRLIEHDENRGVSSARNSGMAVATGKYIGFIDADDYVDEVMYERLFVNAEKTGSRIACCGFTIVSRNGGFVKEKAPQRRVFTEVNDLDCGLILNDPGIKGSACNKIFLREGLNRTFDTELWYFEDLLFFIEALLAGKSMTVLDECYYNYRMHEESISTLSKGTVAYAKQFIGAYSKMLKILKSNEYLVSERFITQISFYYGPLLDLQKVLLCDVEKRERLLIYRRWFECELERNLSLPVSYIFHVFMRIRRWPRLGKLLMKLLIIFNERDIYGSRKRFERNYSFLKVNIGFLISKVNR